MRRGAGHPVAGTLLHDTVGGEVEQRRREEVQRRFELGEVEVLPLAGAVAAPERRDDRRGREPGHDEVGVGLVRTGGVALRPSGEVVEPGEARQRASEADVAREGAGLPLHGQADHHQVGLDLGKLAVPETQPVDHAGGKALGHDVGPGDEPLDDLLRLRLGEVEADAPLRGVVVDEVARLVDARLAFEEWRTQAAAVDASAALDLDDVGPEERQELGRRGPATAQLKSTTRTPASGRSRFSRPAIRWPPRRAGWRDRRP